ncbi:MAG: RMD1 family protein [Gemmatimonadota bacterium]
MHDEAALGADAGRDPPIALRLSARYLGERIDTRSVTDQEVLARQPLVLRLRESGWAVLFRFGAAVCVGLTKAEEDAFLGAMAGSIVAPFPEVEAEELTVTVDPDHEEGMDEAGILWLRSADPARLQVAAEVVAKSTALAHYESEVGQVLRQLEPWVEAMRRGREAARGQRRLVTQLGEALKTQARVMGRLEVAEKPEVTWDDTTLDRVYERLGAEFELEERDRVLARKTDFISQSAALLIDTARHRQTLRVEWYIVILILIEIVILVFDLMRR